MVLSRFASQAWLSAGGHNSLLGECDACPAGRTQQVCDAIALPVYHAVALSRNGASIGSHDAACVAVQESRIRIGFVS